MKIKYHFFYVCSHSAARRTYGGCNYTLQVYQNKGKGRIVHIGEVSACTSAHRGEVSEAWGVVMAKLPHIAHYVKNFWGKESLNYFSSSCAEKCGIVLQNMGGAR